MLMSALLNRATEDVRRIWKLRDAKQALQVLIQRGSLGDETATRFGAAEKELEAEVVEVVAEANTFKQGWGQWIFLSASEMATKDKLRQAYRDIDSVRLEEGGVCRRVELLDATV
jgi:translocation protein SEC66